MSEVTIAKCCCSCKWYGNDYAFSDAGRCAVFRAVVRNMDKCPFWEEKA